MTRDTQVKMSKKEQMKTKSKKEELSRRKHKMNHSSDSDNNSKYSSESEEEMDIHEYRKYLTKLFPSKHLNEKVKAGEKLKQKLQDFQEEEEEETDETPKKKETKKTNKKMLVESPKNKNTNKGKSKNQKSKKEDTESESEYETVTEEDEEYDDDEEDTIDDKKSKKNDLQGGGKYNIIFTIGSGKRRDYYEDDEDDEDYEDDEDEWTTDTNYETENEDDPVSSDSSSSEDEKENVKEESTKKEKKEEVDKKTKTKTKITPTKVDPITLTINEKKEDIDTNSSSNEDILKLLKNIQDKDKNNEMIHECIKLCEDKIKTKTKKEEKKIKKEKDRNERIFRRILKDKNTNNDFDFFHKMEIESQKKVLKELREINKITRIEKPYRLTLLEANIPIIFKGAAMKKISSLRYMEPGSGEYYKIKNWVDTFMRIPFGAYKTLPIHINDGIELCHDFMHTSQKTLNDAVYGLNDAKMQIMQMLGQLVTNPSAIGSAIAIHGPPGTGKTSLVKEGISKILNRPFAFIALGGATDSSFLEGHSYTYEGSTWGKIVQILIDSKCMNPVIYFDELDKISDTPKGEEIAGILTHLTDTTQNSQFHDKYFAEIDFDLSKCLFIFSYNDESKVNPILRDRMYRIQTKGYNQKQKTTIANNYLLPKIKEQVKFEDSDIIIPDETIHYIIEHMCNKEDGVRNLKRCLEIIYTKLNLYRLMKPGSNLFEEDMSLEVTFPFTVTKQVVDKLIKINKEENQMFRSLYI